MIRALVTIIAFLTLSFAGMTQTLGEKYQLPEEAGELRTDGVYHLPASLLPGSEANVEAYFRFFPDNTFIVLHSRVSPEKNPEYFQVNCNYQFVSSRSAPFNKDFAMKTAGNIARAKIPYDNMSVLLEMDVRTDVIQLSMRKFGPAGERMGAPETYVMPFHQITWPVVNE